MDGWFIQNLSDPAGRLHYFTWVLFVVISIVLHELGHGWMALRLGDPTPRMQGRMTGNPLVHMGPFSLAALFLTGIAWGSMPIDPSRLKGRYGEAKVALAGPAMNVGLAGLAILSAVVWLRVTGELPEDGSTAKRGFDMLWTFSSLNVLLAIFNLMPIPPLDGSHALANFNPGYARWLSSDNAQGVGIFLFIGAFLLIGLLINPIMGGTLQVISELGGVYLELVEVY